LRSFTSTSVTANADDGNAACELGKTFLQLLAVVVGGGVLDLLADLGNAASISAFLPAPSTMVVFSLVDRDLLGAAQHVQGDVFELDAEVFGDHLAAGQDAMSSSMALRRSPKPGALTAAILRPPRSLLTTSVASASPSTSSAMISSGLRTARPLPAAAAWPAGWRASSRAAGCRVFQFGDHLVGVGHEVGRQVAAVELHAFDDFEFGFGGLGFLDGDDAFVADLLHGFGDHLADFTLAIGGDGADLLDFVEVLIFLGLL
jgi:hypothetical protein